MEYIYGAGIDYDWENNNNPKLVVEKCKVLKETKKSIITNGRFGTLSYRKLHPKDGPIHLTPDEAIDALVEQRERRLKASIKTVKEYERDLRAIEKQRQDLAPK